MIFARLEVLEFAGDHAGFDERDDAVGDQFAVDAEILAIHEHGEHGVGNAADASLEHGAVFDQVGDVARDGGLRLGDLGALHFGQRTRGFDQHIQVADVNKAVTEGARHLIVHLGDHEAGTVGGGQGGIHAHTIAAEPVRIGRGDLNQRNIERHGVRNEQLLDLAQVDWGVIGAAVVNGFADIGADKDRVMAKVSRHLRGDVRSRAHGEHVDDLDAFHIRTALHQRFDKSFRFGATGLDVNSHARLHIKQGLLRRTQFLFVVILPGHRNLSRPRLARSASGGRRCLRRQGALVADRGVVNGAIKKLIEQLHHLQFTEGFDGPFGRRLLLEEFP